MDTQLAIELLVWTVIAMAVLTLVILVRYYTRPNTTGTPTTTPHVPLRIVPVQPIAQHEPVVRNVICNIRYPINN
jgi:hypothetical protein